MAAEISEITQSNQTALEHILTDMHEALRLLRDQGRLLARHDAVLEEFRPLLDQFRSPLATAMNRRGRRNGSRD